MREWEGLPHVIGSITLNQHCTFNWRELATPFAQTASVREIDVENHHCRRCVEDLGRLGVRIRDLRGARSAG